MCLKKTTTYIILDFLDSVLIQLKSIFCYNKAAQHSTFVLFGLPLYISRKINDTIKINYIS